MARDESFNMRDYAERVRRLFTSPDRSLLEEEVPKKRGMILTFCILASCLLWFSFSMRETYTQFFDFPTQVQNLPDDRALVELPPSTVRVQVEGEGIQLLRLYYNPPTVPLNVNDGTIDLQVVTAEVAGNVRHEAVVPGSIRLLTDERAEKRVPIRSRLDIRTESGYEVVGPLQLSPDSVTVSGAATVLRRLEYWPTRQEFVELVRDTVRARIPLADTLAGLVSIGASETSLQADVVRFTSGSREIEVRMTNGPPDDSFTFEPPLTTVTYNVPLFQFDLALEADDFYAFVPYDEIVEDTTGSVYPMVNVPEGILLREIHIFPEAFRYYRNLPGLD